MKKTIFFLFFCVSNFISAQQISVMYSSTIIVKNDGTLWGWGLNGKGQLGDGTTENKNRPTQIGTNTDWVSVVNSGNRTYALKKDGTLWCWGYNEDGLLGDGTSTTRNTPTQIGTDTNWKTVITNVDGSQRVYALKTNGTLWGWGVNNNGQLGDGTTTNRTVPKQIGTDSNWNNLVLGYNNVFAIKTNGTLWGWGYNRFGQLGDGTTIDKNTPTQIGADTNWKAVYGNYYVTFAIKTNGTIWGWGTNDLGQLGDGTTINRNSPTQISADTDWESVISNGDTTIAIKTNGTLWNWGKISLEDGTLTVINRPTQLGTDTDWETVKSTSNKFYALKKSGTLWAWEYNYENSLGEVTSSLKNTPTKIGSDSDWEAIYPTYKLVLGIKKSGQIWTWGDNSFGQLGNGTFSKNLLPTQIGSDTNWKSASAGGTTAVALKNVGTLWGWGSNETGQLADGTTVNKNSPIQIGTDSDWKIAYSNGTFDTSIYALKTNGTLWAWGKKPGTSGYITSPTQIGTDRDWKYILSSSKNDASYAIKTNGTLWGWGQITYGNNSGSMTYYTYRTPTQIGTDTNWKAVYGNYNSVSFGIKTNGTLWGWGTNFDNLLVNSSSSSGIRQIGSETNWESISLGSTYVLALKTNGTIWGWGTNDLGQLGDSNTSNKTTPTQIGRDSDWKLVVAGITGTSMGIKNNGTLWGWGNNYISQLGNNSTRNINTPTQIGTDSDWESVDIGLSYILAKKTNGTLWSWGDNTYGQLGNGEVYLPSSICFSMNNDLVKGELDQSFLTGGLVSDIKALGTDIKWYASRTGGTSLTSSTTLVNGTTYYASQTVGGCESLSRLGVTITIFDLPFDNFAIETKSETCSGKNNGEIKITAKATYNYIAKLGDKQYPFQNNSLTVSDLAPGTYRLCIEVGGQSFKQCFDITIAKGGTLTGKSSTYSTNQVVVDISEGTAPFEVLVNGTSKFQTNQTNFTVDAVQGDLIMVKSSVACEGIFSKTILDGPTSISAYPNPTSGEFEIAIHIAKKEIYVELYSVNSVLISSGNYPVNNQKIHLNIKNESNGIYIAKVYMDTPVSLIVIKK